ncbi:hypothetical protein RC52_04625 [Herbaspirillum rubrisubalbicans]|nr:hypothetical protein [Herbaspirillum rubrisubalbicans]
MAVKRRKLLCEELNEFEQFFSFLRQIGVFTWQSETDPGHLVILPSTLGEGTNSVFIGGCEIARGGIPLDSIVFVHALHKRAERGHFFIGHRLGGVRIECPSKRLAIGCFIGFDAFNQCRPDTVQVTVPEIEGGKNTSSDDNLFAVNILIVGEKTDKFL